MASLMRGETLGFPLVRAVAIAIAPNLLGLQIVGATAVAPERSFIEAPLGVLDVEHCFGAQEETGVCENCGGPAAAEDGPCVDGQWGPWGPWQACSVTCGGGLQRRSRREEVAPSSCGRPAVGSEHDLRSCEGQDAAVAGGADGSGFVSEGTSSCTFAQSLSVCKLGDWSAWSACTSCTGGRDRVRRRGLEQTTKMRLVQEVNDRLRKENFLLKDQKETMSSRMSDLQEQAAGLGADDTKLRMERIQLKEALAEATQTANRPRGGQETAEGIAFLRSRVTYLTTQVAGLEADDTDLRMERIQLKKALAEAAQEASRSGSTIPTAVTAGLVGALLGAGCSYFFLRAYVTKETPSTITRSTRTTAGDEQMSAISFADPPENRGEWQALKDGTDEGGSPIQRSISMKSTHSLGVQGTLLRAPRSDNAPTSSPTSPKPGNGL